MQDLGFVYYWHLHDYTAAAHWFQRAAEMPGRPLAAPARRGHARRGRTSQRVARALGSSWRSPRSRGCATPPCSAWRSSTRWTSWTRWTRACATIGGASRRAAHVGSPRGAGSFAVDPVDPADMPYVFAPAVE